ncbi:MAG: hypothetical protein EB023_12470, partial [Flavobacteriia bacterium]|nr:hypothetical protein [Flavobacteriia bacterium]
MIPRVTFLNFILPLFYGAVYFGVHGQTFDYVIPWSPSIEITHQGNTYNVPSIDNRIPANGIPCFSVTEKLKSPHFSTVISNVVYQPAEKEILHFLQSVNYTILDSISIQAFVTRAGKEPFLSVHCQPYFYSQGVMQKMISFRVELKPIPVPSVQKDFAANSVLAQGN